MSETLRELADVYYGKSPADFFTEASPIPIIGTGGVYGHAARAMVNGPAVLVPRNGSLADPRGVVDLFWPVDTTQAGIPRLG